MENEGNKFEEDMRDYRQCIQNLANYSKNANLFILIHKFDKIRDQDKE